MKKKLYDYSKGLNAPLLDSRNKKQSKVHEFGISLHQAVIFFLLSSSSFFVMMLLFGGFILIPISQFTHSISLLLYWYIPYKLAKFYTEYEPHGKKMHVFIGDYIIYLFDFKLNKKAI